MTQPKRLFEFEGLNPVVRLAIVLFMAFALMNVARVSMYLIGSIQYFGAPQRRDIFSLIEAVLSLVLGGMAAGLKRQTLRAWWKAVIGGGLFTYHIYGELQYLLARRARGIANTEVQIALLSCIMILLPVAVLLLLTPSGRAPFWSGVQAGSQLPKS